MMQPVCIPADRTRLRVVRGRSDMGMPRMGWHCKNVLELIWPLVGTAEFTYKYISETINQGPGIIKRMDNTGIVRPAGKAMAIGNTNKWALSSSVAQYLERKYGPCSAEAERKCMEFNDRMYQDSVVYSRQTTDAKCERKKTIRGISGYGVCQKLAWNIWAEFGLMEFTFADLSAAGYQIQPSQTAAAMKKHGFVEQIDRRQGVNVYRLIESEIRGE